MPAFRNWVSWLKGQTGRFGSSVDLRNLRKTSDIFWSLFHPVGWGYWIKWSSAYIVPSSVSYTVNITIVIVTERPEGRPDSEPRVLLTSGCGIGILQREIMYQFYNYIIN